MKSTPVESLRVSSLNLYISTKSEEETKYNREQTFQAFEKIILEIKNGERYKQKFGDLVYFNIFKAISELNKKKGVADYEYYKDKTDYYYDIQLPFLKKRFVGWISGKEIKKFTENK